MVPTAVNRLSGNPLYWISRQCRPDSSTYCHSTTIDGRWQKRHVQTRTETAPVTLSIPTLCTAALSRRQLGLGMSIGLTPLLLSDAATANDFITTPSGLKVLDIRLGTGESPREGDRVSVDWAGYTAGYQGKKIDNTSQRDDPFDFVLGAHQVIPAFEEAVQGMKAGGLRRIEVPGNHPELGYPRDRALRFVDDSLLEGKIFKYRFGPQPADLGGQRALDFVLDNPTLQDFNRNLVFDIKLLAVRR
eukprot:jgi/Botrbrau1/9191/Bobra.0236s0020.1